MEVLAGRADDGRHLGGLRGKRDRVDRRIREGARRGREGKDPERAHALQVVRILPDHLYDPDIRCVRNGLSAGRPDLCGVLIKMCRLPVFTGINHVIISPIEFRKELYRRCYV